MPLLYLLFFGPLLTGLPLGARGSSWQILVPGLLLQLGLFGASFAGFIDHRRKAAWGSSSGCASPR